MHYSAENKESRSRDSVRNKKESKGADCKALAKGGANTNSSGKSTPKHSRDKKEAQISKEKANEDLVKSDYYNNENFGKKSGNGNPNSLKSEMNGNNKKSRRNMANSNSKR